MNRPVSVIMPAYNSEKYVSEAIDSILSQTFDKFEFIIIDDCSTDNTWKLIKKYAESDRRIVARRNRKNIGIAGNRNKGISLATGRYILWQDADDISMPNRIEKQFNFMEENTDVGILGGFLQFFNDKGEHSIRKYAADDATLRRKIFRYSPVAQPAAMIRKSCLDRMGEYDLRYPPAEDLDMSFRIGTEYKFANLPEILIKYRENETSATFTKLRIIELNTLAIRKRYSQNTAYFSGYTDQIYNLLQYVSIYLVPARLKIRIFNSLRNSR